MTNRQLFTLKFKSSRLKEFGYSVDITFEQARENEEVIALADNQILRSIRDITGKNIDYKYLEELYSQQTNLKKANTHDFPNAPEKLKEIQNKINEILYIPEYITIVMEQKSHYKHIYKNGLIINGKTYRRFSCSAGQARVSTVVFCDESIIDELKCRLNNGRKNNKMAPSKFNAYFGLYGSATQTVSEPKFIVVKDFINTDTFKANYVTETEWEKDDLLDVRDVTLEMNRTDGMGLISPTQAEKWASELGLDYIPSQFGIRQSFMKGMLCTFPIHQFCEEKNGGNYIVDTIYQDADGEPIKVDLRDYDVIISESQFKLWDSYDSIEDYISNCHNNQLYWGVPQYAPKEAKDILKLNYQFLQTLNLGQQDIQDLCELYVDWIKGVSYENFYYMLLFLMGVNHTKDSIEKFLKSSDNYWLKSLILCPKLQNDRYILSKIKQLFKKRLQDGCMGEIIATGNFQILVSDPYGFMQQVCGLPVTGLLKKGEFYSNYWNERNVSRVDGMRSPLTYRSEHVILSLIKNEETEKWYRYCKLGIILNYHGHECVNFGGSDFDLDILATTNNKTILKGVFQDELPVVYDPPKPQKIDFIEDDLYHSDTFSFGTIIGSITNKSSNGYALLPNIEEAYGKDSREYIVTKSRLQQCCKAQSAQIDKTKIGRSVKGIPNIWVTYQRPEIDSETGEYLCTKEDLAEIQFYNSILIDKYPYFFKYRYRECKKALDKYIDQNEVICQQKFRMSLKKLKELKSPDIEQAEFLQNHQKYMPVIYSKSPMNLLCEYIESINFHISDRIKSTLPVCDLKYLKADSVEYSDAEYDEIMYILKEHQQEARRHSTISIDDENDVNKFKDSSSAGLILYREQLKNKIIDKIGDIDLILTCLIDYYYIKNPKSNKDTLWKMFGKEIFNNLKKNCKNSVFFPLPDDSGPIIYLKKTYSLQEVDLL